MSKNPIVFTLVVKGGTKATAILPDSKDFAFGKLYLKKHYSDTINYIPIKLVV